MPLDISLTDPDAVAVVSSRTMATCQLCGCVKAVQQSFFGTAQSAELAILLDESNTQSYDVSRDDDSCQPSLRVFGEADAVTGKVSVKLRKLGSKLEHQGIKIELIGVIDVVQCHKKSLHQFYHSVVELAPPGELYRNITYNFSLERCSRPYESYHGTNVQLRYFLRVTLFKRLSNIVAEHDILVQFSSVRPEVTRGIKTEIGIGDQLRVELECDKWKYHLRDVICGSIYFVSTETDITGIELQIVKRELTVANKNNSLLSTNEIVALFEILDGNPKPGDRFPIRIYLSSCRLTPTMRNIEDRFTVKYYLNLVIADVDDNKYFKQQEVTLYRKDVPDTSTKCSADAPPLDRSRNIRKFRSLSSSRVTFHAVNKLAVDQT